jgi:hypothetical protein
MLPGPLMIEFRRQPQERGLACFNRLTQQLEDRKTGGGRWLLISRSCLQINDPLNACALHERRVG